MDDPGETIPESSTPRFFSRRIKIVLSIWLSFHVLAIIVAPLSVSPTSGLFEDLWRGFQPYLESLALNNGYHFFAPEPTSSTLIDYEAERADGTVVKGRIPDRSTWPRLLYHRYFMLTEQMESEPEELGKAWAESYARHLASVTGARKVRLTRVTHLLATMDAIREGAGLEHPESYETEPLGEFEWER